MKTIKGGRTVTDSIAEIETRPVVGFKLLSRAVPLALLLVAVFSLGTANAAMTFDTSFGSSGTGNGQFSEPSGVAVNDTTGDVYVADSTLNRVEQFTASGSFIRMWGFHVNKTTNGNICPVNPGDECGTPPSLGSGAKSAFSNPQGVAVDNSLGSPGYVYVEDVGYHRIQKFTASGEFLLMWGEDVNESTGGYICTAAETCKDGVTSGGPGSGEPTPPGGFAPQYSLPELAVDGQGYIYVGDPGAGSGRIQKFAPDGTFVAQINPIERDSVFLMHSLSVNSGGDVAASVLARGVRLFPADTFTSAPEPTEALLTFDLVTEGLAGPEELAYDPASGYFFIGDETLSGCGGQSANVAYHVIEFRIPDQQFPLGQEIDCTNLAVPPAQKQPAGMTVSKAHKLYLTQPQQHRVLIYGVPAKAAPTVAGEAARDITTTSAAIRSQVVANLLDTTVRVEYGLEPCSANPCKSTAESKTIGSAVRPVDAAVNLQGLEPGVKYFYRVIVTNALGSDVGGDHTFGTFPSPVFDPSCPNNLARQQTSASGLSDCRAYELVSAGYAGGYNVESDLVPGQTPMAGYPQAPDRALYALHDGIVPDSGKPTNHGPDAYVATRDAVNKRWNTRYVGIPADVPSNASFSSALAGADSALRNFAFDGPDICNPCFDDGSKGIPLHLADGSLVQGMAGSIPVPSPVAAGEVKKRFSDDGAHFVFGSKQQFEPAGNSSGTDVTIYDRNLNLGTTEVASTLPNGSTMSDGDDVAELDISHDGSRILIGDLVGTDTLGNKSWHLYMHIDGLPESIDLTPGTTSGVLYSGMTNDGGKVFFTTPDPLALDSDASADLYESEVGTASASLTRLSTGSNGTGDTDGCDPAGNSFNPADWNVVPGGPTDCSVVAVGGGGGVATADGSISFLSPEQLDGSEGVAGAPNLYLVRPGSSPHFVSTLESGANSPLPEAAHGLKHQFGSFTNPEGIAIDHLTGSVYVLDNLTTEETPGAYVQKFDASGNVDSSFGAGGKINGAGTPSGVFLQYGNYGYGAPTSIAVDNNPASPSYRDLYVADMSHTVIDKFGPSGNYISQIEVGDYLTGLTVSQTTGDVYVTGLFGGKVYVYNASGAPVKSFPVAGELPGIAVDSSGNTYVTDGTKTRLYDSSGSFVKVFDPNPSYGVAVDPADGHIYVDRGDRVVEFESSGAEVGTTGVGKISGSIGLAADSGRLVVSNRGGGNVVEFGPPVTAADRSYDSPLVVDSVREKAQRHTSDFQVTPDGDNLVFSSTLPVTGFDSNGNYEVFRYDASGDSTLCVSCNPTGAQPASDASLASNGLSLTDDGRVFFNTGEPLVLRDANRRKDAYEWKAGAANLISTGTNSFDSGLLSVSADGEDAFFFTHDTLTNDDQNGTLMKLYDARAQGGFFTIPSPPPCAASDECHGPGSRTAPAASLGSLEGDGGNMPSATSKKCKRGFVRKHGKCVKRKGRKRNSGGHSNQSHG